MATITNYRRREILPMRPYVPGEPMDNVYISPGDKPQEGGMIVLNGSFTSYISRESFLANYEMALDD